jgi:hypothetical protein
MSLTIKPEINNRQTINTKGIDLDFDSLPFHVINGEVQ